MEIIPRREAVDGGLLKYFTGRPCKHGHLSERYTLNGVCCECSREYAEQLRKAVWKRRAEIEGMVHADGGG